jgi:1-pyrroline-5-carboxylate dehydrogenase
MDRGEFRNEPLTDFSKPENKSAMEAALTSVAAQLGRSYDIVIDGERLRTEKTFSSLNPSKKDRVVGVFPKGTKDHADRAIRTAHAAFETWRRVPAAERSGYLFRAADEMRRRKHEFSAWMVYEVGKTWPEADADTAEAIDFLEFYGRENLRYSGPQPITPIPGEKNALVYLPLGVGVVIPPWNFPLAIMAGMASAAIVSGNTVVLKPSSDSPVIAAQFVTLLESVGLPKGVLNFLPGSGGEVGDPIVEHPLTRFVAFTGSKEVGLHINELAAKPRAGQRWIKRVVAEMGGKDGIIVDREADIDQAVQGVVTSAFGFQGQKCSACSRAIVDATIYDAFLEKLKSKVEALKVGPAEDPKSDMGPVVNAGAMKSIQEYIEIGQKEGRLLAGGGLAAWPEGYFLRPTVIADVGPKARLAQEEIFGPVLAVIKARDFDDALKIANNTEFGLTGAIYSKNPEKIERAKREFFVGNLYVNRKCTGAMVGGHPFGGFNMSGTDSKAGGRDYLLLFLQAQAIAEKVMA